MAYVEPYEKPWPSPRGPGLYVRGCNTRRLHALAQREFRLWHEAAVCRGATSGRVLEMLRTLGAHWPDRRPWPEAVLAVVVKLRCNKRADAYSITSSARASIVGGTSSPSTLAAFGLITSSYLVGACTGRSAGNLFQTDLPSQSIRRSIHAQMPQWRARQRRHRAD
jgi:hypothetical protein